MMGYTHYWYRDVEMDADTFRKAAADCRKLCEALPIPLGDWNGEGKPEFSNESVSFNGHNDSGSFSRDGDGLCWPAKKAQGVALAGTTARAGSWFAGPTLKSRCVNAEGDGSYESFVIECQDPKPHHASAQQVDRCFACCKTNFRPYDLCVQGCLIVFKQHFGESFIVHSDGDDDEWNEARDACQVFLGYGLNFKLDAE